MITFVMIGLFALLIIKHNLVQLAVPDPKDFGDIALATIVQAVGTALVLDLGVVAIIVMPDHSINPWIVHLLTITASLVVWLVNVCFFQLPRMTPRIAFVQDAVHLSINFLLVASFLLVVDAPTGILA
jgi:hypothetical protein